MTFSSTAPAHPHATGVAVYPALFQAGQLIAEGKKREIIVMVVFSRRQEMLHCEHEQFRGWSIMPSVALIEPL